MISQVQIQNAFVRDSEENDDDDDCRLLYIVFFEPEAHISLGHVASKPSLFV